MPDYGTHILHTNIPWAPDLLGVEFKKAVLRGCLRYKRNVYSKFNISKTNSVGRLIKSLKKTHLPLFNPLWAEFKKKNISW